MLKIFNNNDELSINLASYILKLIEKKPNFVLGCPGGRSLKLTYKYIGLLSYQKKINLSNIKIIMMDEYVYKNKKNEYKLYDSSNHFSCVGYANRIILKSLNYKKHINKKISSSNCFYPSIKKTNEYDKLIKKLGGIDLFLLASGSSDGHVAFNNSDSKLNSTTHIIKLKKTTRTDNLKTFKTFKILKNVPKYGITVGLGTIYKLSKKAVLVLAGKEKNLAAKIILKSKSYNKQWPASIIYKCKKNHIYIDNAAIKKI